MVFGVGLYPLLAAVGGLLPLIFLRTTLRNREKPGAVGFFVLIFAAVVYALSVAARSLELTGVHLFVVQNFAMLGASLGATGWFLMYGEYAGLIKSKRRALYAIGGFIVTMQLCLWTNPIHHLFYDPIQALSGDARANRRILYWVFPLIMYGLVLVATVSMVIDVIRSRGIRRRQGMYMLASSIGPVVLITVSGTFGLVSVNLTPLGFVFSTALLWWAMFRAEFLEIVSVGRLRAIETLKDPFVILDDQNRVVDSNPAARKIFAATDDWDGVSAAAFFGLSAEEIDQLRRGDTDDTELTVQQAGSQYYFDIESTPITGAQNEQRGQLVVFRDVTRLKRREKRLERKNRFLDEFASVVSHDIATPLSVVENKAQLIELTGETSHTDGIYDATEQVREQIEALRNLARQGRDIGEITTVSLEAVAGDAWRSVETADGTMTVSGSTTVEANQDLLRQLLENLFRNSVEHGFEENQQTLRLEVGARSDGFYVADNGAGISEQESDQIFQQGYTTSETGSGLGLAIVRRIVEGHGWEVEVSESESGGVQFNILTTEQATTPPRP